MLTSILLILACVLLVVGIVLLRWAHRRRIHHARWPVNEQAVVLLDDETGVDIAVPQEAGPSQLPGLICVGLGVAFLVAYVGLRPPSEHHGLQLSYEEYAMHITANALQQSYLKSSDQVVRVMTPLDPDPYLEQILNVLRQQLTSVGFSLSTTPVLHGDDHDLRATVPELRSTIELVEPNAIVVSVTGIRADSADRLPYRRPAVVCFAPTAALQEYARLISRGLVDMVILSRGTYAPHSMIPRSRPLETIRDESFLVMTATNVEAILRRYRQTVEAVSP